MVVQVTVQMDGREVQWQRTLEGTPTEREVAGHALGREVARVINEAALIEAAGEVRHPCCCGKRMENRGRRAIIVRGLDGPLRIKRTRDRCRSCGCECLPVDGLRGCGRHRITRPLAKRVCQLATVESFDSGSAFCLAGSSVAQQRTFIAGRESFTRLPQLVFGQHGVCLSHREILDRVHAAGGAVDALRRAEVHAWAEAADKHWPAAEVTPRRVYVSCDGIMDCTNLREPHPDGSGRQRLKWQQMRVGCVYWQDEDETWHKQMTWGREDAQTFGASLYRLACRCGYRQAEERIFAAGGGEWCWSIPQQYFASAQGIPDGYHASEHVWEAARVLHPDDDAARRAWADQALTLLHDDGAADCWRGCSKNRPAGGARNAKRSASW